MKTNITPIYIKLNFVLSVILLLITSQLMAQVLNKRKIDSLQFQLIKKKYSSLEKALRKNEDSLERSAGEDRS